MAEDAVVNGSSVVVGGFMYNSELVWGKWYRSKGYRGGDHPYSSYMLNKKWTLEEELNNHMLRFQQVNVGSIFFIKLNFDIPGWIVKH